MRRGKSRPESRDYRSYFGKLNASSCEPTVQMSMHGSTRCQGQQAVSHPRLSVPATFTRTRFCSSRATEETRCRHAAERLATSLLAGVTWAWDTMKSMQERLANKRDVASESIWNLCGSNYWQEIFISQRKKAVSQPGSSWATTFSD